MAVWALADLHLSFGTPDKEMNVFGPQWNKHAEKIKQHWTDVIQQGDLVLVAGDISWAMHPEGAKADLDWIDTLPGTKVMVRGNHDYWWTSLKKVQAVLPKSIHVIQNDVFVWNNIAIAGARLWDTDAYTFKDFIDYKSNPRENTKKTAEHEPEDDEKIFQRELGRLEMSLKQLPKVPCIKMVMTHYPPIGADLKPSLASALLERYGVTTCVFGHLHNVKPHSLPFGTRDGVTYILTSCDYLDFKPIRIL